MDEAATSNGMAAAAEAAAALAEIFREFGLARVEWEGAGIGVLLERGDRSAASVGDFVPHFAPVEPARPTGTPVPSPMTGIYYDAPTPSAKPFVQEGDAVTAGQVVGLIEAMKVYSEIVSPISGTVLRLAAKGGNVVNPGDPLMFIG